MVVSLDTVLCVYDDHLYTTRHISIWNDVVTAGA